MTSVNGNQSSPQPNKLLTGYDPRLAGSVRFTATNQATGAGLVSNPTNAFFSMLNQAIQQNQGQATKSTAIGLKEKSAKEAVPETESDTDLQAEETNRNHDVSRKQDSKNEKETSDSEKVHHPEKSVKEHPENKESSDEDTSEGTQEAVKKATGHTIIIADEAVGLSDEVLTPLLDQPCLCPASLDVTTATDVMKGLPVQQALLVNELNAKDPALNGVKNISGPTPLTHPSMNGQVKPLSEMPENAQFALMNKSNSPVFNPLSTAGHATQPQDMPNLPDTAVGKEMAGLIPENGPATEMFIGEVPGATSGATSIEGLPHTLTDKNSVAPMAKSIAVVDGNQPGGLQETQSKTPDNLFINQLQTQGELKSLNTEMTESDKMKIKAGEGILSKMSEIAPQAVQVSVNLGQTQTNTGNFGNQPQFSDFEGFESDSESGSVEGPSGIPSGFNIQGAADGGLNAMGQSAKVKVAGQTPMDQVVNATKMAVNNGQKEMTLQLNPDNMGQVRINLVSTANGQLHARFVASTQETQQELNAKVEQLRASLEKQGVNVGQITVIAAGETGAGNQNGNQNANQQAQNDLFRQPEGNVNPNQQGQGGQSQTQQQSNATGNPIPNSRQNNASTGQGSESQPSETNPPEQNMRDKNMRDGSRVSVLI
jgi:hypothetical protein